MVDVVFIFDLVIEIYRYLKGYLGEEIIYFCF